MNEHVHNSGADRKFSLILLALGVLALTAIGITWFASQNFARQTIHNETERLAKSWHFQLITMLEGGSRTFLGKQVEHNDQRFMKQLVYSTDLYRISFIDEQGQIFWSTKAELKGSKADQASFAATSRGAAHIEHGQKLARNVDGMESLFLAGKAAPGDKHIVAKTFLPVLVGRQFAGAIELDFDNTKIVAVHEDNIHRATLVLCAVFALIFLIAGWVAFRHNQQRRAHFTALLETHDELQQVNMDVVELNKELDHNITELREAQEEIIRKGKMAQLGQLTATIAHDIRNPLGAVRTAAFLIERKFGAQCPGMEKPLGRINNGVVRCDGIITELLDFARTKAAKTKAVNVDEWLLKNVQEQADRLPDNVQIECHLGLQDAKADFDPDSLQRVLVNLLSNASEAMLDADGGTDTNAIQKPKIVVSSHASERGVEIHVADNGPGISAELQKKILEPLFTTKKTGVGLGLPAVEKVLEQHGGGLEIKSREGNGTTMVAWFPNSNSGATKADQVVAEAQTESLVAAG